MKATAPTLCEVRPAEPVKSSAGVWPELIKARLTGLVLVTTFVGYYIGNRGPLDLVHLFHTLLGTGLLAAGAAALNQCLEREFDAQMSRTAQRPLPAGKISLELALLIGAVAAGTGMIYLAITVNLLTSVLGVLTLGSYLFVYTPLKRKTTLNTVIGAIPGALPPLMGWTAARGELSAEGWTLFAIQFLWQLPHFLAIAWLYRDDYARAGFVMLPVVDREGTRTGPQAVSHALGLVPISLFPGLLGLAGYVYCVGALILGLLFLFFAVQFSRHLTQHSARRLFIMSIIYLPLLLGLMVMDKLT
jgi:protoheme IX farnesyltransferase